MSHNIKEAGYSKSFSMERSLI